jgi:hypothetical protein
MNKPISIIAALYLAALALLTLLVSQATPAPPTQAIRGIGIGSSRSETGIAYVSGRRLACSEVSGETQCIMQLAGKPLTIRTLPSLPDDLNLLEGPCEATYNGKSWPCELNLRHVHVAGFAYISDPLGLTPSQLATLRRHHPIENLPDHTIFLAIPVIPLLTALVIAVIIIARLRAQRKSGWTIAFTTAPVAVVTLVVTFIATIRLTSSLLD